MVCGEGASGFLGKLVKVPFSDPKRSVGYLHWENDFQPRIPKSAQQRVHSDATHVRKPRLPPSAYTGHIGASHNAGA